jgi:hypothetical protein
MIRLFDVNSVDGRDKPGHDAECVDLSKDKHAAA